MAARAVSFAAFGVNGAYSPFAKSPIICGPAKRSNANRWGGEMAN
jgi:hypothetical protein